MALKPWHKIVTPRQDLCEGKPLDASEFAVHLDKVRDGKAPEDYQDPKRFFDRTYLTENITDLAGEVIRRLSGERTETSAVFNLATQFGGGKTHALTLLYHLAKYGPKAHGWQGVFTIINRAGVKSIPRAKTAVFVGTEFDSLTGRGGKDGTPLRKTPWGEIAYQLGGEEAFKLVQEHEEKKIAPAGEVIQSFLPKDEPCLILIDELMNYITRNRRSGLSDQLYVFLQSLTNVAASSDKIVIVVSIPGSTFEMNDSDQSDYTKFDKMINKNGKHIMISAGTETSEIIRRRLFEWTELPAEAKKTIGEYSSWVVEHRQQIPSWFPVDQAKDAFAATYPFHPMVISVFERKWQTLPSFHQTRGVLRLLALWVSNAYQQGAIGGRKDALIGLGSAPLDDSIFRSAVFSQLGENKLEGAVTTDICGKPDSHAVRLDQEAADSIKKAKLHQKVATVIFFESNGGMKNGECTLPEIRLAVGEPDLDIGNVDAVLEDLAPPHGACFFLDVRKNNYWFSLKPNLAKVLADRKASVESKRIDERATEVIRQVFAAGSKIDRIYFPTKSSQIPDTPALKLVVVSPEYPIDGDKTIQCVDQLTRVYGSSGRTYKSSLIWAIAENTSQLREDVRKLLAWEDLQSEKDDLKFDDGQKKQLDENVLRMRRDVKETVWRTYRKVALLDKNNKIQPLDLGLIHSSSSESIAKLIIDRLTNEGLLTEDVSPNFLKRNWPPAFVEWSTQNVRDTFFASPLFPRLINPEKIKDCISNGVLHGQFAYGGKPTEGTYDPIFFKASLSPHEIEISQDMYIIPAKNAEEYLAAIKGPSQLAYIRIAGVSGPIKPNEKIQLLIEGFDQNDQTISVENVQWDCEGGEIDRDGIFIACKENGICTITASVGAISQTVTIQIKDNAYDMGEIIAPHADDSENSSIFSGEISSNKLVTFYRILEKVGSDKNVKIFIRLELLKNQISNKEVLKEINTQLHNLGLKINEK